MNRVHTGGLPGIGAALTSSASRSGVAVMAGGWSTSLIIVLAGVFLASYLGLAGPVIGLGALTQIASTRVSLLLFAALLGLGILAAARPLLGHRLNHSSAHPQPVT